MKPESPEVRLILEILEDSYSRQTWHGPNLRGSLRGISHVQAAWRPGQNRHNIWEIAVHAAYWKYAVRRRITGEKRGSFPVEGSNWFQRPEQSSRAAWLGDRKLLDDMHKALIGTVAGMTSADLRRIPPGSKIQNIKQVYGVALHDVYHAGQIQLLKRLKRKGQ